jgi:hypothetical protein
MQFLPNFTEFAYGAPLPIGNLLKGAKITFGAVAKGNRSPFQARSMLNSRIALKAHHFSNLPLG